ncbi:MAG TPA: aspartyl protease family protein [Terracidiphilus sp.]
MNRPSLTSVAPILALFVLAPSHPARAQQTPIAPHPIATIPFVLFHNRVYLPVQVNGKTFEMILDTGAAISGLSQQTASALQLQKSGTATVTGNGESRPKIELARNVGFRLGDVELLEKLVGIEQWDDLELREGKAIAGFLGVNLFRRYVVELDYPNRTLSIFEPENFVYAGPGARVTLIQKHGAALFHAVIQLAGHDPIPSELAIDSGTYSALRLYRPFVEKHHLLQEKPPGIDSYGFGLGGEFSERLGRVASLKSGALEIKEPVTAFSTSHGGATSGHGYDGTIGGEILSHFRVILDYPDQRVILEPASNFAEPWESDTSGAIFRATDSSLRTISVAHVLDNTPAAAGGLKGGDIISSVNEQKASSLGVDGLRRLFYSPGKYHLEIQRGQKTLEADITTTSPLY